LFKGGAAILADSQNGGIVVLSEGTLNYFQILGIVNNAQ
jgi:hypothetical protein